MLEQLNYFFLELYKKMKECLKINIFAVEFILFVTSLLIISKSLNIIINNGNHKHHHISNRRRQYKN
jgi:hypothetical protein